MVKTAAPAQAATEKKQEAAKVVPKKKFTVAANGKKVPVAGTIAKPTPKVAPAKKAAPVPAKATATTVKVAATAAKAAPGTAKVAPKLASVAAKAGAKPAWKPSGKPPAPAGKPAASAAGKPVAATASKPVPATASSQVKPVQATAKQAQATAKPVQVKAAIAKPVVVAQPIILTAPGKSTTTTKPTATAKSATSTKPAASTKSAAATKPAAAAKPAAVKKVAPSVGKKPKAMEKNMVAGNKENDVPMTSKDDDKSSYMPGQKYATPEEGDSLRIFYESLREQRPESRLALRWLLEHGLCTSRDEAIAVQKQVMAQAAAQRQK